MPGDRVIIIGAGAGGLACAIALAARGLDVTILEAASVPGGKIRTASVGEAAIDAGPTVFTMRWVFEELFTEAGVDLADRLTLAPLGILARHAWDADGHLDLHADCDAAADAIGAFAGASEARGFRAFCTHARDVHDTLRDTFMTADRPSAPELMLRAGIGGLLRAGPFSDMWTALGRFFRDPRLRQLFGRYATYCGSSPFRAPATLMLVAHVEQEGVWSVEGGMVRLAQAMADLATEKGAHIRYEAPVHEILLDRQRVRGVRLASGEVIESDYVVVNADADALSTGLFGQEAAKFSGVARTRERSLSAVTYAALARTSGFPLSRHNVFFSRDYAREFDDILTRKQLPSEPTVYVCAQDRDDEARPTGNGPERLLLLVNAPAIGDMHPFDDAEIAACAERTFAKLRDCGLTIEQTMPASVSTPRTFGTRFPATGGALYGPATHGAMATFARSGARTKVPGLYLAGGSVHPGPGVPMAALSGRIAARNILADHASTRRFRPAAMPGGMSTR